MAAGDARRLGELLGLGDDELCAALGATPLDLISGDADSLAAVSILIDLTAEAEANAGAALLRRWVRTSGPGGVPLDLLTARNYGAFEDSLAELAERGFVIRQRGS